MKQRRISRNLGKDTHVRDHVDNIFQSSNHETYGTQIGSVLYPEPEPFFRQNMVTVEMARGGRITSVAYPGASFDPITGNLHGSYEGPIPGQMVMVGFENGNQASPYVVNRYPYQGVANSFTEFNYLNPMFKSGFHAFDVIMGHFSGAYISMNTGIFPSISLPGSISVSAITDIEMSALTNISMDALVSTELVAGQVSIFSNILDIEISAFTTMLLESNTKTEINSAIVSLSGITQIELNGKTDWAIKFTAMQTAFNLLKTELNAFITIFNAHTHAGVTTGAGVSGTTATPGTSATADMSSAKNLTVLM